MQPTWKPVAAGVLAIIAGVANILVALALMLFMVVPSTHMGYPNMMLVVGVPFIGLGAVAIAGGISSLQRRSWAFALAGCICAAISPWALLGIIATVFVAISREEYPPPASPSA